MSEEELEALERWKAELAARSEAAARRRRPPPPDRLTPELIDATPDNQLEDLILEFVDGKKPEQVNDYSWLDGLRPAVRMAWCSIAVEGELGNGGFNQFFFNGTDALAPCAIEFFDAVGAGQFAEVIREALDRATRRRAEVARSWGQGSMADFMGSYSEHIFDDLDERFQELYSEVNPSPLRTSWLRALALDVATSEG